MGQALKAGAIGDVIGAATGFLNFAAGSTSATSPFGKILEKAGKHAFADMWMGEVKNAVYGGDLSPVRDMIEGALSSLGNGYDQLTMKINLEEKFQMKNKTEQHSINV